MLLKLKRKNFLELQKGDVLKLTQILTNYIKLLNLNHRVLLQDGLKIC